MHAEPAHDEQAWDGVVEAVHEAVEEIVSAARAEAESQAERLRAELAEIEARLAELREAE